MPAQAKSRKRIKKNNNYTDSDKRQVCVLMNTLGNITKVAEAMNMPHQTVTNWLQSEWYDVMSLEVQEQVGKRVLERSLAIVDSATSTVMDRLEYGDPKIINTKNGHKLMNVPISGKDSAVIGAIYIDKARVQMGLATSVTSHVTLDDINKGHEMTNRERLIQLRIQIGFTVEQESPDQWAVMLEDTPWDVFDSESDALNEAEKLNHECADCI